MSSLLARSDCSIHSYLSYHRKATGFDHISQFAFMVRRSSILKAGLRARQFFSQWCPSVPSAFALDACTFLTGLHSQHSTFGMPPC
jgi:hypothetical protein